MKLKRNLPCKLLQILLFNLSALCLSAGSSAAADLRILKGTNDGDPACTAVLRPIISTEGQSDLLLRLISRSGQDLTIAPIPNRSISRIELVFDDTRIPFPSNRAKSRKQLEESPLWQALQNSKRFHLTAWFTNGKIKSSRFENFNGPDILAAMEKRCNFALAEEDENTAQDDPTLSSSDIRLANWALNRIGKTHRQFLDLPDRLSTPARAGLKRFQKAKKLPQTGNLDRETYQQLLRASGVVIAPRFTEVTDFTKAGVAIKSDGFWGQMDLEGNWITKPFYEAVLPGQNNAIPFRQSGRWIALDKTGKRVPRFLQASIGSCRQDWCLTRSGQNFGLVSLKGLKPIKAQFDFIDPMSDGRAFAQSDQNWQIIETDGRVLRWPNSAHLVKNHWKDSVAVKPNKNARWQIWTLDGNRLARFEADEIWPVSEGIIRYRLNNRIGFVSARDASPLIEPKFSDAGDFSSGMAPAKSGNLWGYVDRTGRWVIKPAYSSAASFFQTLAVVKDSRGRAGLINTRGELVLEPQFSEIRNFANQRAAVKINGKWGFLDRRALVATRPR